MTKSVIILTPFVARATVLYHALKSEYSSNTTFVFADNGESLHGKKYDGIEIISAEEAQKKYINAKVIICENRHSSVISKQYTHLGFTDIEMDLYKYADNKSMINAIGKVDFEQMNLINSRQWTNIKHQLFAEILEKEEEKLVFKYATIYLTNRCTLRCRDCISCMQYYKKPKDYSLEDNIATFNSFMEKVDFVAEFGIIGGEPFLYKKHLPAFLTYIGSCPHIKKIGLINITTNGTIIPDEKTLRIISKFGIQVSISDYGSLSKKIDALIVALNKYKINFSHNSVTWYSMCKIVNGEVVSDKEMQIRLDNCKYDCKTIANGKLFACSFLASVYDLKAVPYHDANQIDLMDSTLTKSDIKHFILYAPSAHREQRTENREQRTENREQRTEVIQAVVGAVA